MNIYDSFDWNKLLAALVKAKTFRGKSSLVYYHELLFQDCVIKLQTNEKEGVLNYPTSCIGHLLDYPRSNPLLYTYGKEEDKQCILDATFLLSCFLSSKKAVPEIIKSYKIQDYLYYCDVGTNMVPEFFFYIRSLYAYGLASVFSIQLLQMMKDERGEIIPDRAVNLDLFMIIYHYYLLEETNHYSFPDNWFRWNRENWDKIKNILSFNTLDTVREVVKLVRKEA